MKSIVGRRGLILLVASACWVMAGCGGSKDSSKQDAANNGGGDAGHDTHEGTHPDTTDQPDAPPGDLCSPNPCARGMQCAPDTGQCSCFGAVCAEGTVCDTQVEGCVVDAPAACRTGQTGPWQPGTPAFRDASAEWGLKTSGANATRISVVDVDGDGWADLSLRMAGTTLQTGGDDFSAGGSRRTWLLKNSTDGNARKFVDITQASGLVAMREGDDPNQGRPADVVVWGDLNNDGFMDAYTGFNKGVRASGATAEVMLNNGDATFRFAPEGSAVRNARKSDSPGGASFVDYDRDGFLDLWVTQYAAGSSRLQDQLFKGDGSGDLADVTEAAGLKTQPWTNINTLNAAQGHSAAWGALACDLNGDGTPELLASSYGRAPNHLWRGVRATDATVSFQNESVDSGYAFDARRDWTDNESARCFCKLHRDAPDCAGVPEPQYTRCASEGDILRWSHDTDREAFRLGGNSGTTVCADLNNDGWMDLLTTEIVHWDVGSSSDPSEILYNLKEDAVRFARPGNEATGLTRTHDRIDWNDGDITAAIFDFDNDGRKDIYIGSTDYPGTRGHLWHQKPDGTFQKVSLTDGIDHTSSHGVGIADFNRDGSLDIVVGHSRNRCSGADHCYAPEDAHVRIFENMAGKDNNWLQIDLEGGAGTNRKAIGARVTVQTTELTQVSQVDGGHGHYGVQHDLVQHFGLGAACTATVTVRWPDRDLSEETFVLRAGHRYHWAQGQVPTLRAD